MTELINVTHDEINSKIMIILCANEGNVYDQYNLYSRVIDKFMLGLTSTCDEVSEKRTSFIPPTFKYKFMLVFRNLMTTNNNIKVIKENNVYNVVYNPPTDIVLTNTNYDNSWLNTKDFNSYIIDSDLHCEFAYKDIESGDTMHHDILGGDDYTTIKRLIDTNYVDYNVKNNFDKTPIECINDIKVATLVISNLNLRVDSLESRIKNLEVKDFVEECSIYNFLKLKLNKFIKKNLCSLILIFIGCVVIYSFEII